MPGESRIGHRRVLANECLCVLTFSGSLRQRALCPPGWTPVRPSRGWPGARIIFPAGTSRRSRMGFTTSRASYAVAFLVAVTAVLLLAASAPTWAASGPDEFHTLSPCRMFDTRTTDPPALPGGVEKSVTAVGKCGVPTGATAVAMNVTAIDTPVAGNLLVYPTSASTASESLFFPA